MSAARMVKTDTEGVFRRGGRWVAIWRDYSGRQRSASAATKAEAIVVRASKMGDARRGAREPSRMTFAQYAPEWIASYTGRTSRGIRQETVDDYRKTLGLDKNGNVRDDYDGACQFLGRLRLSEIGPSDIKRYARHLGSQGMSKGTVRLRLAPVRALLATALEDELIVSNPSAGLRIGHVVGGSEEDKGKVKAKALTHEELRALIREAAPEWRLLIEFLAHTGLRVSEALALRWDDLDLGQRRVRVRRRWYRGGFAAPKSRFGKRDVPISKGMARALWLRKGAHAEGDALVFARPAGGPFDGDSVHRVVSAAGRRAGIPSAHPHMLRHTCASMLFARGLNAKQVQAWLGHHSASFTLDTYVHLLTDELPDASFLDSITAADEPEVEEAEAASG